MSSYFMGDRDRAKAVMASLWFVNDASTSLLMQQFYQSLSCPVLVGRKLDGGWPARVLGWADCWAEGITRETALQRLAQRLQMQLAETEVINLEIPLFPATAADENPWLRLAGKDANDPNWDEYMAAIAANHQEADVLLEQNYRTIV